VTTKVVPWVIALLMAIGALIAGAAGFIFTAIALAVGAVALLVMW
jgi:hypothetical protein